MPTHVHGVIVMKDHPVVVKNDFVGVEYIQPLQDTGEGPSRFQHVSPNIDNPMSREVSIDDLREALKTRHGLTGSALERVIEHEVDYRQWWDTATDTLTPS